MNDVSDGLIQAINFGRADVISACITEFLNRMRILKKSKSFGCVVVLKDLLFVENNTKELKKLLNSPTAGNNTLLHLACKVN